MAKLGRDEVLRRLGGSADQVGKGLAEFNASCDVLSSNRPRLIDAHPMEWVGVFHGRVTAAAPDYNDLMVKLAEAGSPAGQTIVRFIDKTEKTFIL